MSEYAGTLVEKSIQDYESKHGEIQLENEHAQGRGGGGNEITTPLSSTGGDGALE